MIDVARAAGCSQSTVSMVLNGNPSVSISDETRRRVAEAVAALGYRHRVAPRPGRHAPALPGAKGGATAAMTVEDPRQSGSSRTAWVAGILGRRIIAGHYGENAILPGDAELIGEFGVSRTVLREALKTLSGKGLVQAKSRIGTRVRLRSEWQLFDSDVLTWHAEIGLDSAFLRALGEMRLLIEPEAAALAAARRQPAQLPQLYEWVAEMAAADGAPDEFVAADLNFHLEVARIAANPFLRALSTLIRVALFAALTRSSPASETGGVGQSAAAHRAIADAIAAGDAEAARQGMRAVILEGIERAETHPAHF